MKPRKTTPSPLQVQAALRYYAAAKPTAVQQGPLAWSLIPSPQPVSEIRIVSDEQKMLI